MPKHPLLSKIRDKAIFESLRNEYGTPTYIYFSDRIKSNLSRLVKALNDHFQQSHICYALKANTNPHLISTMKQYLPSLCGDCSSPGELFAAQSSGIDLKDCIYTGNYESQDDLVAALDSGSTINLDDKTSLDRLLKIGLPEKISFRVNPGFGKGRFSQITTAGNKAKFGIPKEQISDAYRAAQQAGIRHFGLQCMAGSGVLDQTYFNTLLTAILEIAGKIERELNIPFEFISMGGGFGIPYHDDDPELDIYTVFKSLSELFYTYYPNKETAPALWIEPGKYIIGDAGILLTTVTGIKESYKTFIGTDAGMETLMRPALYNAYHRIYKIGDPYAKGSQTVDITGRICENTDRLAVDRPFPIVREGDLIAIMDVGAYGFSMSHQFNNRPRSAEILMEGNNSRLIRRRETIKDLFITCDV